jgi:hypothetical protein
MEIRSKERIERAEKIAQAKLERVQRDQERKESRLAKEAADKEMELRIREAEIEEIKREADEEQERVKRLAVIQREKNRLAATFYRRTLICEYGLSPWMKFVAGCRKDSLVSVERYKNSLVVRTLRTWMRNLKVKWRAEEARAVSHSNNLVHKKFMNSWQGEKTRQQRMQDISAYTHQTAILRSVFTHWNPLAVELCNARRDREMKQTVRANKFYTMGLEKRVLRAWKVGVGVSRDERWSESRREVMRERVRGLLSKSRLG